MPVLNLPPSQLSRFTDSVCFHLRRAHEAVQQRTVTALAELGLLPIHAEVLGFINDNPGTIPSVIAAAMGRDRSSITGILRTLLEHGLIDRARTARDRRAALLNMTATGEAILRQVLDHTGASEAVLDRILGADKPDFLNNLHRIITALAAGDRSNGTSDEL